MLRAVTARVRAGRVSAAVAIARAAGVEHPDQLVDELVELRHQQLHQHQQARRGHGSPGDSPPDEGDRA